MQSLTVVPDFNELEALALDLAVRFKRIAKFSPESAEKAFHRCVVPAIAFFAHAADDTVVFYQFHISSIDFT